LLWRGGGLIHSRSCARVAPVATQQTIARAVIATLRGNFFAIFFSLSILWRTQGRKRRSYVYAGSNIIIYYISFLQQSYTLAGTRILIIISIFELNATFTWGDFNVIVRLLESQMGQMSNYNIYGWPPSSDITNSRWYTLSTLTIIYYCLTYYYIMYCDMQSCKMRRKICLFYFLNQANIFYYGARL